ncbi:hypothetical protein LMH87_002910 [Akanthomyces muscarius]|uniref:Uncharacterized protein n=1 Tax=Akanthomyces muscarius TaxID=2231603 RepID=A0A9W8QAH1_AKAMU|nr:hypothetical protein LMH87_002910 [Akanthomyces muscarius]KAJ4148441.1 hypothetical protein LMH87_002910 [Akanthomyces muscarius]
MAARLTSDAMIDGQPCETKLQFAPLVGLAQSTYQGIGAMDLRTEQLEFMTEHEASGFLLTGDKQRLQNSKGLVLGDYPVFPGIPGPTSSNDDSKINLNSVVHNDGRLTSSSPIDTGIDVQSSLALQCPHPSCNSKAVFKQFLGAVKPIRNLRWVWTHCQTRLDIQPE